MRIKGNETMRSRQHGYSLVEVLIAMAITSIVLLTVVTLFYMGRRNVYSGKQMTVAAACGTQILEDLSTMTAQDLGTNFNLTDATTLGPVTLQGVPGAPGGQISFDNSIARDTGGWTVATTTPFTITGISNDPNGYMTKWFRMLIPQGDQNSVMAKPVIGLIFTPRNPTDVNKKFTTAQFIRTRIYVSWQESVERRRYAFFDTTKVNR
jgi:prepilin-type N-terminal cleavage/methylation domain-containing protein